MSNGNRYQDSVIPMAVSFVAGALLGAAAGGALALLTAPQSGEATRDLLRHKSLELRDQAADTVEDARKQANRAIEDAQARSRRMTRDVESKAKQLQRRGKAILAATNK